MGPHGASPLLGAVGKGLRINRVAALILNQDVIFLVHSLASLGTNFSLARDFHKPQLAWTTQPEMHPKSGTDAGLDGAWASVLTQGAEGHHLLHCGAPC